MVDWLLDPSCRLKDLLKTKVPVEAVCCLLKLDLVDKAVVDEVAGVEAVDDQAAEKLWCCSSCSSCCSQAGSLAFPNQTAVSSKCFYHCEPKMLCFVGFRTIAKSKCCTGRFRKHI